MDSTPDHSRCDDSEYGVSEPLHPTLTAPVVWVRSVPRFVIFSRVLTARCQIQDSAIVTHPGNGSPSPDLRRHHSVQHGPSPRTSPARGVFDLSPTHRGATDAEHEICPRMDNPDLDRTPDPVQSDPSNGLASMTFWGGSIYDPPVPVGPLPTIGGIASLTNTEFLLWPQGVSARDSFTSYPNSVSEERIFPQNSGPLIQPSYSPNCAARPVSTTLEHSKSNHFHLSRSGSQGPPLIINSNYVRCEMSAQWRCLEFDFSQDSLAQYSTFMSVPHDSDSTFSPKVQMTVVPQRSYARTGDREKHKSISFMVNGRLGIPARDAIEKIYAGLDGRDDQVFVDKPSVMMLRLEVRSIADCEIFNDR